MRYYFIVSFLLGAITCYITGLWVYFSNKTRQVNKAFLLLSLNAGTWSLGHFIMAITKNYQIAWAFCYILYGAAILIPPFFLYFIFSLLDVTVERKREISLSFLISFALLLLLPTRLFIRDVIPKFVFNYYDDLGLLGIFFLLFFLSVPAYALFRLLLALKKTSGVRTVQLKYAGLASIFGFVGGATTFTLAFNIEFPLYSIALFSLYPAITTYAIVRHRLMEIEVVIKKTLIFTGLFIFVAMSFVGSTFIAQEFLTNILGANARLVVLIFSITIITLGMRPLENLLIRLTDRFLFQKKYDYQQTLKEASEGMTLVTNMKKLLNLIVRIVSKSIRVKSAAIFQYEEAKNRYVLKIRRGTNRKHTGYSLESDHALIWWLRKHKETLLLDEIEDWLRSERFLRKEKGLKEKLVEVKEELSSMDGVICVPSFSKGHLIGFLVLGEKLSGDIYTQEDVKLLSTLASEAAIAVENAKNFMELEKARERERESYLQTVLALAQTVDEKDSYTHGHLEQVCYYGMRVAEELEESTEFKPAINREDMETALRLHDIGKIGVPDAILHKNGNLTPEEWSIMKQHCEIGARIVEPIEKLKNVGRIIKHHQEKYDGSGYPDGLKGEEIPIESRIIAVVDSYHAMVSDRPYRKALPDEVALAELKNNIGTQFDPVVVGAFVRAWEKGKIKKVRASRSEVRI